MLEIHNQGQAIIQTNYWDSEQAAAGYCYLSWNAGAGMLRRYANLRGSDLAEKLW